MMRTWLLVIFLLFLYACSGTERVPSKYLQPEKMTAVLLDLYTADAINTEYSYRDSSFQLQLKNKVFFERVFKLHKITRDQFETSYSFYLEHPVLLKRIVDSLDASAGRMSKEVYSDTSTFPTKKYGRNLKDTSGQNGD
jgi:hypothetical protein